MGKYKIHNFFKNIFLRKNICPFKMPNNKCTTSCSTSESSDVSCSVDCKTQKDCRIKSCPCYSPEEIICKFGDAVVEIHSEFILLGGGGVTGGVPTGATGGTPLGPNTRADIILEGNGFFIKGHYIIAPAHLVLLPPSLTSVADRFPFFDPSDLTLGRMKDQMIRASRILVSVFNVNNKRLSFVYEADLVGVDGAGDIAVLSICHKKQWNLCNPHIDRNCHPYLKLGASRAAKNGEKVYLIGDYVTNSINRREFNAVGAISEGILSDHRYLDYSGFSLPENILVSAPAYAFSSGLPILDCRGYVLGMQTTDLAAVIPGVTPSNIPLLVQSEGSGLVSGPSEFFMRRVIKSIIKGTCSRNHNNELEVVCDPAGSYYRYLKAYAGIAYDVFTGIKYDITTSFTSGSVIAGYPRVRLCQNGDFLYSPTCKELVGIRVLGLAGANPNGATGVNNGLYFVPGGNASSPFPPVLPISPFNGRINPGDVITHINNLPIGDLPGQIAPSLITWRLCPGDQLEISYRRGGNSSSVSDVDCNNNYDNLLTYKGCLCEYPAFLDYPWSAVNIFPLLSTSPFPAFVFPPTQIINPQVPAITGGALFHPAF